MEKKGLNSAWKGKVEQLMTTAGGWDPDNKRIINIDLNKGYREDYNDIIMTVFNLNLFKYQGVTGLRQYLDEFQRNYEVNGLFKGLDETTISDYWKIYNRIKVSHPAWDSEQIRAAVKMVLNKTIPMTTAGPVEIDGPINEDDNKVTFELGEYQDSKDFIDDVLKGYTNIKNKW